MLRVMVLTLLPVTVTNMALLESLATVKLLICAPLPLSVWVSLMQLVTVSLRPPYHLTVLMTVASPGFMTENIPPRVKVALTYLKQVPLAETEYEPPPVITVGVEHGLPPGTGVLVMVGVGGAVFAGVFVGVLEAMGVFVRVGDGPAVLVGVFVGTVVLVGVLLGTNVFVGVFEATGVLVGVFVTTGVLVGVFE